MKKKNTLALSLLSLMLLAGCKNNNNNSISKNSASSNSSSNSKITNNSNLSTNSTKKSDSTSKEKESYKITVNATGVTLNGIPKEAKEGDLITFTATLDAEKVLSFITIDGENALEADKDGKFSFTMPKRAVTVDAITADKQYNINVTQVAGATISVSTTRAKKNEIVKVRVTIGDVNKKSPVVKADDVEVTMTIVEDSKNTFEGQFQNTGKDMSVTATLTDAAIKHAITDKGGDGVIVSGPTGAVEGETVTFRIGLEEGFEFNGDVKVTKDGITGEEANVEVTKNDDGSYSFTMPDCAVTITRSTTASIFKINTSLIHSESIEDGESLTLKDVQVEEYASYKSTVTVEILSNNYYTVDKVEANGVQAILNSNTGKYEFEMPSCAVDLKITTKAQRYILNLGSSDHVTLEAYIKDAATGYTKAPLNGVTFKTQVYIKPVISDENYGVKSITVKYSNYLYSTRVLSLNEDGYYTDNYYCTPDSKNYLQLDFTVEESEKVLTEDDCLYGDHIGFIVNDSYEKKYNLDMVGNGKYNSTNINLDSYDKTNKTFSLKDTGGYSTYYGKVLDDVTSYIYDYSSASSADDISNACYVGIYLKGTSLTTKEYLANASSIYSATKYIAHIANENGDKYVLVDTKATIKVSLVTVKFLNDATSINTKGALFEVTNGSDVLYFNNTNNILTEIEKGEEGTYTGKLEDTDVELTTDGLSKISIKEGETTTDLTFKASGKLVYFTYNGKTYFVTFDSTTKTFTKENYQSGYFYGKYFSYSASGRTIYLKDDFTGYSSSSSYYTPTPTSLSYENGMFKIGTSDKFVFSPDGETIAGTYSSDPMILSKKFSSSSMTGKYVKNTTNKSFVATIYNKADDNTSVYFDGTKYMFGTIDNAASIDTKGSSFKFTDSSDNKAYYFKNNNGDLETDDASYLNTEYTNSEFGKLTLKEDGTGTLIKDEITTDITYTRKNGIIVIKVEDKQYTITLNNDDKTYTYEEKEVIIPTWLKGKTFKGKVIISGDSTCYFVFDSTKTTLSCSAGSNASDTNPLDGYNCKFTDIPYEIEDGEITFTLDDVTLTMVLDEDNKTFTFKDDAKVVDGVYFRNGNAYTFKEVTSK